MKNNGWIIAIFVTAAFVIIGLGESQYRKDMENATAENVETESTVTMGIDTETDTAEPNLAVSTEQQPQAKNSAVSNAATENTATNVTTTTTANKSNSSYKTNSYTTNNTTATKSKNTSYHDTYDDGYDAVYDDEDYDIDRYDSDSDYASGVDDAMDELGEDW